MLKVPFGLKPDGTMVPAAGQPTGLSCECACPACGARLIARHARTSNVVSHFSHQNEDRPCEGAVESAVHRMAKQLIAESRRLFVPEATLTLGRQTKGGVWKQVQGIKREAGWFEVHDVLIEETMPVLEAGEWIRPDVVLVGEASKLLFEVKVTHAVGPIKLNAVRRANLSLVELDLSKWTYADLSDIAKLRAAVVQSARNKKWLWHSGWAGEQDALKALLDQQIAAAETEADQLLIPAAYPPDHQWRSDMRARFGKLVGEIRANAGGNQRVSNDYPWPEWAREFQPVLRKLLLPSDAFMRARFKDPFGWQIEALHVFEQAPLGALIDYHSWKQIVRSIPGKEVRLVDLYKRRHMKVDGNQGWSFLKADELSALPKWNDGFDQLLQNLHNARLILIDADGEIRKIGSLRGLAERRETINTPVVQQQPVAQPDGFVLQYATWVYASHLHAVETIKAGRADKLATCHRCKHISAYQRSFLCLYCGGNFGTEEGTHDVTTGNERIQAIARRLMTVPDEARERQWVKVIKEYLKPVIDRIS